MANSLNFMDIFNLKMYNDNMIEGIKAVAFDIDGTLYPDYRLYIRMPFYFIGHLPFFLKYNKVRKTLHKTAPLGDFYEFQSRLLAEEMHVSVDEARDQISNYCYKGLIPYFEKIKPYKDSISTALAFKEAGLKIAILSDFPPEQKGSIWGLRDACDVVMGTEECGALKPSIYPFRILAEKLGVKPEEVLYVGNSNRYDVAGSNAAGMKSAFILKGWKKLFGIKNPDADISFSNYRQLREIVL